MQYAVILFLRPSKIAVSLTGYFWAVPGSLLFDPAPGGPRMVCFPYQVSCGLDAVQNGHRKLQEARRRMILQEDAGIDVPYL
jgi:hypothetical protein